MAKDRKHGLYAVSLGATLLGGITRQTIPIGADIRGEPTSGEIYARFQAMYAQKIAPSFTTLNVAAGLDAVGLLGVDLSTLAGGMLLYAQKWATGASRSSGATHRKYAFAKGMIAPRNLTVEHRGDASLTFETVIVWDGANEPLVVTDTFALPAAPVDAQRYTLGPCTIGGVVIEEVRSLSIDFGIDLVGESVDSDLWETMASIRQSQSTLTFRGIDIEWFKAANIPLLGKAATHANTAVYLRKRAAGASFVDKLTAEHIMITAAGMAVVDPVFDASGNDASEPTLVLRTTYDGVNTPIVIDTTSTHP